MRKITLFFTVFVLSTIAYAYDVEVDGIFYNLIEKAKEAEVTYKESGFNHSNYKGDIKIPKEINVNNVDYKVTSIGDNAFCYEKLLISVNITENVKSIGKYAFSGCEKLEKIIIPNSVQVIGNSAFSNCSSLKEIEIPSSINNIESLLFMECSNLEKVVIPNSITKIGDYAFQGCSNLSEINLPSNLSSLGYAAFKNCSQLKTMVIPDAVNNLSATFEGCKSLNTIILPESLKSIYSNVFYNCSNLKDVYCKSLSVGYCDENAFKNAYIEYATLHVREESILYYTKTKPWCDFGNIIAIKDGDVSEEQCSKPDIYYNNGKLSFKSETVGADFIYEITNTDVKKGYEQEVNLNVTYNISVYALKNGYKNSEVTNATLCWIDVEPKTEGITSSVTSISARPILIQNNIGDLLIKGAGDEHVTIYDLSGKKVGEGKSIDDNIVIKTCLQKGNIAIINIGGKSIKVMIQ